MERGGGEVKFYICVHRIYKGRGSSTHCSKYSLKFQDLKNLNVFEKIYLHKYEVLPPPISVSVTRTSPTVIKSVLLRTDEYALALKALLL